jgi:2'-5' RNA ligase
MRLFTGITIPQEVRKNLERLLLRLKPTADVRWSRTDNLHVTTKFIGEWPEEDLNELIDALDELPPVGKIPIAVGGIGWFPNPHAPRILWTGVQAPPQLAELARLTDETLVKLSIPAETKKYAPHLTLARVTAGADVLRLKQTIAALESVEFGSFIADHFQLYLSEAAQNGTSRYTKLADFPLEAL